MKELQEQFFHYILHPEESKEFAQQLKPAGQLLTEEVMWVYHNDYHARLQSVMGENFTAIWKILGDELFFEVCREYRNNHTSPFFDLGLYGDQFALFLKNHRVSEEYPFLSDLADLEYTFHQFFHAPAPIPVEREELMRFQVEENLKFIFTNEMKIYESDYPILDLWELPKQENKTLKDLDWMPQNFILFKNSKDEIKSHTLTPVQIELMDLLHRYSVQKALELISESIDENSTLQISELFEFISNSNLIIATQNL
ncbi:MAG: hypothetical protein Fur0010_10070 [Bdellovibrio sp.]